MRRDTINGIPRVDLHRRPRWKMRLMWWTTGRLGSTKAVLAIWRRFAAPLEAPVMKATRGRLRLNASLPMVVLASVGARSGIRRETPLAYFTDGDDVILIASNWGGARHPGWYHNLLAHPQCELHVGRRTGRFVARQIDGSDRDTLWALAVERLNPGFALYERRMDSNRTIPMMRLTPESRSAVRT